MNENILKQISVNKEIWDEIKNKKDEFINRMNESSNDNGCRYQYQGSVSTKTIIDPSISTRVNDIDLDLLVIIKNKENISDIKNKISMTLKGSKCSKFEINEKAMTVIFDTFVVNGKEIRLSMDVVILNEESNEVWNNKKKKWIYSNPLSISRGFNSFSDLKERRYAVRLIKALRDAYKINGIKSINILNAVSRAKSALNLKEVINELKLEFEFLNKNGSVVSKFDSNDILEASSDFDYENSMKFLENIEKINNQSNSSEIFLRHITYAKEGKYSNIDSNTVLKVNDYIPIHNMIWKK